MMRLSLSIGGTPPFPAMIETARSAARHELDGVWLNQVYGWDALTAIAALATSVPDLHWGTSVVPTYPRHPLTLASQALTAQAATGNRFTLGIGPGHPPLIEGTYGLPFDRPVAHTREYLSQIRELLAGREVDTVGDWFTSRGALESPGASAPDVVISALGPQMLRVAGELADGTICVWVTPEFIAQTVRPALHAAAAAVGRPTPRVIAAVVVSVTDDPGSAIDVVDEELAIANTLPAYRRLLDAQGLQKVSDTVIAGPAERVAERLSAFAEAQVDELVISPWGPDPERTVAAVAAGLRAVGR